MENFIFFIQSYPALFYAIYVSLGITAGLEKNFLMAFLGLLPLLFLIKSLHLRPLFAGLLCTAAFFFGSTVQDFDPIPEKGAEGLAQIRIEHLSLQSNWGKSKWIYKGRIEAFWGDLKLREVPFYLTLPHSQTDRPLADRDYLIKTRVIPAKGGKRVILKPFSDTTWVPLEGKSHAELRFSLKNKIKSWIQERYLSQPVVSFLSGLVVGEFDDSQLKQDFSKFGLLHLLAISGFHFGIFAALLSLLLRPFLSAEWMSIFVIALLTTYFWILGWGPSVVRAWMTIILCYGACLGNRISQPLNALGVAILFALIYDPLLIENLGFQFSVVTTAAILLFISPAEKVVSYIFPAREFTEVINWPKFDQGAYILLGYFKKALALTFATTVVVLPLSLYYFESFPLWSLYYNLFFPFLVSLSISLLLLGFLLTPFPVFAQAVHHFNDHLTSFFLNLTYDFPSSWEWNLEIRLISLEVVSFLLIILFLIGISLHSKKVVKNNF